jgi:hypothetical protein
MSAIDKLIAEHRQIMDLADQLLAATGAEPFAPERLSQLRLELAQAINRNVAAESALLERLRANPVHRVTLQRYFDELSTMRQAASLHQQRWNNQAVLSDRREYRIATRLLVRRLAARIAWEEEAVLPLLDPAYPTVTRERPMMRVPVGG